MSAHPHDRHDESVSRERRAAAIMHLLNQEAATLHLGARPVHPKQGGTGEIGGAAGREHNHSHAQPPTGPAMGSALAKACGTAWLWHRRRGGALFDQVHTAGRRLAGGKDVIKDEKGI